MMKRIVRVVVLVTLICLFSVYGSGVQRIKPGETIVLAKNVIIKGPFMTPKMYKKPDLKMNLDYDWSDDGVEFLPLGRVEDRNQMFIPIEPLEAKYKFLRDCFTKGSQ